MCCPFVCGLWVACGSRVQPQFVVLLQHSFMQQPVVVMPCSTYIHKMRKWCVPKWQKCQASQSTVQRGMKCESERGGGGTTKNCRSHKFCVWQTNKFEASLTTTTTAWIAITITVVGCKVQEATFANDKHCTVGRGRRVAAVEEEWVGERGGRGRYKRGTSSLTMMMSGRPAWI